VNYFNFNQSDLKQISLNAIQASFLSQGEKQILMHEFQDEFRKLEN
jgi:adenosine deaminase